MWAKATWIYKVFSSVSVFFMTLDVDNQGADCDSTADVDRHLDLGKKLLAAGQLTEALSHYHAAVEGDPDNYMTYFKRAAVYLALGRSKSALPDLENVIKKRPDFSKAREQRGNIYLKQGELDLAMIDFELVLSQDPDNHEIHSQFYPPATQISAQLSMIEPVKEEINRAKMAIRMGDYHEAIESLSKAIEVCPWDATLREMRANCYEGMGELVKAIGDLRPTTKLINGNTDGHLRISHLHYKLGEADESLKEIRECLKLDPDHKKCFQHYKKVKKLVKFITDASNFISRERFYEKDSILKLYRLSQRTSQDKKWYWYSDAIFKLNAALKLESREKEYLIMLKQKICHCQLKDNKASEAIKTCTEVVQIDDSNLEALCDRGEAYLLDENYDDAIKDFHAAKNINGDFRRAHEGLERAQKLQKQAKKKDYYKILGVRRTASKPEILKAYRKLAVKWHPDHYKGDDRKKAEKMFVDVAAAKEVLTDPEKRAKFDNGEDPLDPNQQQGGQPFQWGDGGFPFGDGFNFKFHFN